MGVVYFAVMMGIGLREILQSDKNIKLSMHHTTHWLKNVSIFSLGPSWHVLVCMCVCGGL